MPAEEGGGDPKSRGARPRQRSASLPPVPSPRCGGGPTTPSAAPVVDSSSAAAGPRLTQFAAEASRIGRLFVQSFSHDELLAGGGGGEDVSPLNMSGDGGERGPKKEYTLAADDVLGTVGDKKSPPRPKPRRVGDDDDVEDRPTETTPLPPRDAPGKKSQAPPSAEWSANTPSARWSPNETLDSWMYSPETLAGEGAPPPRVAGAKPWRCAPEPTVASLASAMDEAATANGREKAKGGDELALKEEEKREVEEEDEENNGDLGPTMSVDTTDGIQASGPLTDKGRASLGAAPRNDQADGEGFFQGGDCANASTGEDESHEKWIQLSPLPPDPTDPFATGPIDLDDYSVDDSAAAHENKRVDSTSGAAVGSVRSPAPAPAEDVAKDATASFRSPTLLDFLRSPREAFVMKSPPATKSPHRPNRANGDPYGRYVDVEANDPGRADPAASAAIDDHHGPEAMPPLNTSGQRNTSYDTSANTSGDYFFARPRAAKYLFATSLFLVVCSLGLAAAGLTLMYAAKTSNVGNAGAERGPEVTGVIEAEATDSATTVPPLEQHDGFGLLAFENATVDDDDDVIRDDAEGGGEAEGLAFSFDAAADGEEVDDADDEDDEGDVAAGAPPSGAEAAAADAAATTDATVADVVAADAAGEEVDAGVDEVATTEATVPDAVATETAGAEDEAVADAAVTTEATAADAVATETAGEEVDAAADVAATTEATVADAVAAETTGAEDEAIADAAVTTKATVADAVATETTVADIAAITETAGASTAPIVQAEMVSATAATAAATTTVATTTGPPACPATLNDSHTIDSQATLYYALVPSNPTGSGNGLFCAHLEVSDHDGWIALGFSADDQGSMSGSDAVVGFPWDGSVLKYNLVFGWAASMEESSQTLMDASVVHEDGNTVMTFTKLLTEQGEVPIWEDESVFLHARGRDGRTRFGYHGARSSFKLSFESAVVAGGDDAMTMLPANETQFLSDGVPTEPADTATPKNVSEDFVAGNIASLSLTPIEDTWLEFNDSDVYGDKMRLKVDGKPTRTTLLKFNMSALSDVDVTSEAVVGMTLKLYSLTDSIFGGLVEKLGNACSLEWGELEVSWVNARKCVTRNSSRLTELSLGTIEGPVKAWTWNEAELDFETQVPMEGLMSLRITSNESNGVTYASRHNETASPELVVSYIKAPAAIESITNEPTGSPVEAQPTGSPEERVPTRSPSFEPTMPWPTYFPTLSPTFNGTRPPSVSPIVPPPDLQIQVSQDAMLRGGEFQNISFGVDPTISLHGNRRKGVLEFDVSDTVPGFDYMYFLQLYITYVGASASRPVALSYVTTPGFTWDESTASWNSFGEPETEAIGWFNIYTSDSETLVEVPLGKIPSNNGTFVLVLENLVDADANETQSDGEMEDKFDFRTREYASASGVDAASAKPPTLVAIPQF
ncbi:hypothetical protein ACHAWF_011715 [Thalassiosira exigua]